MALNLYRVEFYDLRDIFHDANVLAESADKAVDVLRQYFAHARVSVLFKFNIKYTDPVCYADERAFALNGYKYGFFPVIKNR